MGYLLRPPRLLGPSLLAPKRAGLLGSLSPEYRQQSSDFLRSMGLTPSAFRRLLRSAHDAMRADAERERS